MGRHCSAAWAMNAYPMASLTRPACGITILSLSHVAVKTASLSSYVLSPGIKPSRSATRETIYLAQGSFAPYVAKKCAPSCAYVLDTASAPGSLCMLLQSRNSFGGLNSAISPAATISVGASGKTRPPLRETHLLASSYASLYTSD